MERLPQLFESPRVVTLRAGIDPEALGSLTEEERAIVQAAGEKRRAEFATGRRLAHAALALLDRDVPALLPGDDRAPRWPEGVRGSISHSNRDAVVAVTLEEEGSVGVDVEHRAGLKREIFRSVFLEEELRSLDAYGDEAERARMALVLFSAKEALYKAQHPHTRRYMGFMELHVAMEPTSDAGGLLRCTFQNDVRGDDGRGFAKGELARGRYLLRPSSSIEVLTGVFIPRAR